MSTYKQCSICSAGKLKTQPNWIKKLCSNKKKGHYKVCKLFEPEHIRQLIDLDINYSIKELNFFHDQMVSNSIDVSQEVRSGNYRIPNNADDFIDLLKKLHFGLFDGTGINNAGVFRSQDVYFDEGIHMMEGSEFSLIDSHLRECWDIVRHYLTSDKYLHGLALLLPRFFRVHPFQDGNGRVIRMFINVILQPRMKIITFDSNSSYRRRYLKALRFAHRRYVKKGWSEHLSVCLVEKFLSKHLNDMISSGELEEIPPEA